MTAKLWRRQLLDEKLNWRTPAGRTWQSVVTVDERKSSDNLRHLIMQLLVGMLSQQFRGITELAAARQRSVLISTDCIHEVNAVLFF